MGPQQRARLEERRLRSEASHREMLERAELVFALRMEGETYAAIGARIGVSKERVRQMLEKHKRYMLAKEWRPLSRYVFWLCCLATPDEDEARSLARNVGLEV